MSLLYSSHVEHLLGYDQGPEHQGMFSSFSASGLFKIHHFVTNNPKHISIRIQSYDV
jgi:hypothetical protein